MTAPLTVKSAEQVRESGLRDIDNGLRAIGVANPNVAKGSDWYVLFTAIGNELAVLYSNIQIRADAQMPDTATGDDLLRLGVAVGVEKRGAAGSTGFGTMASTASVTLISGEQLVDPDGLRYAVRVAGSYANGSLVPIEAVDTGAATNLPAGTQLRWVFRPAFADQTMAVAEPGLSDGVDDEDEETYRSRVIARYQNPPAGGNWSYVAEMGAESSPKVQACFVYPAHRGPATTAAVVIGYASATNKNRDVDSTTVDNIVAPYIRGTMPEHTDFQVTSVTNVPADVAIGLSLPAAPTASPPGPGGGWLNGTPWPYVDGTTVRVAAVSSVTSSTSFSLTASPGLRAVANVTKVCWVSYSGSTPWTLYTATVTSCTESPSGTYAITLDTPFPGIAVGDYIFPAASNMQAYVDALLEAFASMGPGELRSPIVAREFRHPLPAAAWPNTLGPSVLRAMTDAGEEVLDAQWFSRTPDPNGNYAIQNTSGSVGVPAAVTQPPRIFVPRRLAFYRL